MKKILTASVVLIVLASGCSFFQKKEEAPAATVIETQLEKKIGLVSTAEEQALLTAPSPHLLLTETGEKIFLESLSVNLKRYNKRRVEVEGKWNDARELFTVEAVTSLGNELEVKQKFQNSEIGLKFDFPSVWALNEKKDVLGQQKIIITPYEVEETELQNVDRIIIDRSENNKKLSARKWLNLDEQYRSGDSLDASVYQQSTLGIAGLDAVKRTINTGPNDSSVEFFVARDTSMYHFQHISTGDAEKDLYKNGFFNLVSGFEFIPFGTEARAVISQPAVETTVPPAPAVEASPLKEIAAPELAKRKEAEEKAAKAEALQASQKLFIDAVQSNIFELSGEPQQAAVGMTIISVEFAAPEGQPEKFHSLYVIYKFGSERKKILLSVPDQSDPSKMTRAASFKTGEFEDWILAEGTDTAKNSERTIIYLQNPGTSTTVKSGYRLLDAKSFRITIQYPSSWYWAFVSGGYSFSTKPVKDENVLIRLTKNPESLPSSMQNHIEDENAYSSGEEAEAFTICLDISAKYCLTGPSDYKDIMNNMIRSIDE